MKKIYGLIGKNISYSFSKNYFNQKFKEENILAEYKNFDMEDIEDLPDVLSHHIDVLKGLNVTIPYKEKIFKYLDEIDLTANKIGAVNTIKIIDKYYLKGFNTDVFGFEKSLTPLLKKQHTKALILGTGGASKAVKFVLKKINIAYTEVSRNPNAIQLSYSELTNQIIKNHKLIINTTPLGTYPKVELFPDIPYQAISNEHLLYDLIYNPNETSFLSKGKKQGATIKNGLEMLQLQAEKAWEIWNLAE